MLSSTATAASADWVLKPAPVVSGERLQESVNHELVLLSVGRP